MIVLFKSSAGEIVAVNIFQVTKIGKSTSEGCSTVYLGSDFVRVFGSVEEVTAKLNKAVNGL